MNRDEVERLREMVVNQIVGLQSILGALNRELNSPAPAEMEPYDDLENDLIRSEERALHDN